MSAPTRPTVVVCAGAGGVGKTTTSAALAMACALRGERTLVVTTDPARRLADALGVEIGSDVREVSLGRPGGQLLAIMPDPRGAMRLFVEYLFDGQREALTRLLSNRVYLVLEDAVPTIHELVALHLILRAIETHAPDVVVIDTAPSRQAIDFVTYPKRLSALLNGRSVGWLAKLARRPEGSADSSVEAAAADGLFARVLGPAVADLSGLFSEMALVLDRFAGFAERSSELLLDARARHVLVSAPTAAAEQDVLYLMNGLDKLGVHPVAVLLNRAAPMVPPWLDVLDAAPQSGATVREVVAVLRAEARARRSATELTAAALKAHHPGLRQLALPFIEAVEPRAIVELLAAQLATHLDVLVPRTPPPA